MTEKQSVKDFDENYKIIKERIALAAKESGRDFSDITILAATKTVSTELINHAIESGITFIGENRVQEFLSKEKDLLSCHRHLIGHLQTNKVKDIVGKVELIHSVDSFRLAKEISKCSVKKGIKTDILLEVNIGNEESKSGFNAEEVIDEAEKIAELDGIFIRGLMAIPPICENESENIKYFDKMQKLFIDIKDKNIDNSNVDILSMGMSGDYFEAVRHGATTVRIGTALFGKREYK